MQWMAISLLLFWFHRFVFFGLKIFHCFTYAFLTDKNELFSSRMRYNSSTLASGPVFESAVRWFFCDSVQPFFQKVPTKSFRVMLRFFLYEMLQLFYGVRFRWGLAVWEMFLHGARWNDQLTEWISSIFLDPCRKQLCNILWKIYRFWRLFRVIGYFIGFLWKHLIDFHFPTKLKGPRRNYDLLSKTKFVCDVKLSFTNILGNEFIYRMHNFCSIGVIMFSDWSFRSKKRINQQWRSVAGDCWGHLWSEHSQQLECPSHLFTGRYVSFYSVFDYPNQLPRWN